MGVAWVTCRTGGRAVSEPYYSQRARSVCVSERFFIADVVISINRL